MRQPGDAPDKVEVAVYDLLTHSALLGGEKLADAFVSPDDKHLLARAPDGSARVLDVETGTERTKLDGDVFAKLKLFGFDSKGRVLVLKPGDDNPMLRDWDVDKNAFGAFAVPANDYHVGFSVTGRYMATFGSGRIEGPFDEIPLELRDLESGKLVARWTGRFVSVTSFDVTSDASILATGSYNSVRLWTVADHKQTFVAQRTRRGDNFDDDLGAYAFSDDGKTVVLGREAATMLWDVATGKESLAVSNQRHEDVLGVTPLPDGGVILLLDDAVRVVPRTGDARVLCKGYHQRYYPDVGPTSAVLSPSGKSLACGMSTGMMHVFDTSTWEERAHIDGPAPGKQKSTMARYEWDGVPPSVRPLDLSFSADDATLTVVSDDVLLAYDTRTGKQATKVALRDPKLALARRHARFPDGRILVKTSSGAGALFDATGTYTSNVTLVAGAPITSPDAFSADGKTYAVAIDKVLHRVDLDGEDHTTDLPDAVTALTLSGDGKSCVAVLRDGTAQRIDAATKKLATRLRPRRAFFVGKALLVVTGEGDTLELFAGDDPPKELEVDPNGLIARSAHGTFEVRGRAEAECTVGHVDLSELTCADRSEAGLLDAWVQMLAR